MHIQHDIHHLVIAPDESIINALQRMSQSATRVALLANEDGFLQAVFTDGDLREWLTKSREINLNLPVVEAANKDFTYARLDQTPESISRLFSQKIQFIPLLDEKGRIVSIAFSDDLLIKIGDHVISDSSPAFVIAEIGNNHNGDFSMARRLVEESAKAGANCAKFQMRHMPSLYRQSGASSSEDLSAEYVLDLLSRHQLSNHELFQLFDYCRDLGLEPLCTPWDIDSVDTLEEYGMSAYKVASADLTNHQLLRRLVSTNKLLLVSTGMSTSDEIKQAVALLESSGSTYILLHCNSTYPTPYSDINLKYMNTLKQCSSFPVGYSGHERGIHIPVAAVALGARVIEKHITLDRSLEGSDHKASLLPNEFALMVRSIRELESALGTDSERSMSQGEIINRATLAKSLVATTTIKAGALISSTDVTVRSPGRGLAPNRINELIGQLAVRNLKPGDFFYPSDLDEQQFIPKAFSFQRRWGIPVRYYDLSELTQDLNPDLLEFHFSYKDLELNPKDYLKSPIPNTDLIVHAPELFRGDHLLNLCSEDNVYRAKSISNLQRVIDATELLLDSFPDSARPLIVTNVGGFSSDHRMTLEEVAKAEGHLKQSLSALNQKSTEIIIQTMPPYPWHFGGQSNHNLFVDPDQIDRLSSELDVRICLDISHSKLAANFLKLDFEDFLAKISNHVAHIHAADASGVDGEGLQIGSGDINFTSVARTLALHCPHASFIPEVWQGHDNHGAGFWEALTKLEQFF